jgi:hypothetical protein
MPPGTELLILQIRSVPASLAGYLPAPSGALVGVASRWQEFLKVARAVPTAAGFHPDSLVFRDARDPDWQRGLIETVAVVCDVLPAAELPSGVHAIPFALLSEARSQNCAALRTSSASRSRILIPDRACPIQYSGSSQFLRLVGSRSSAAI